MDRRHFLTQTMGLATAATLGARVTAHAGIALGDTRINAVSDGHLVVPRAFLFGGLPPEELDPILAKHGIDGDMIEPDCTLTLLRDGTNTVLFDIGAGPNFLPTTGRLLDNLDTLGVAPEDVTHVIFTHGHPDHLWGAFDEFDDPTFPEAEYLLDRTEWDYWTDPKTLDRLDDARKPFAVGASRVLAGIEERMTLFRPGEALVAGIQAVGTPGHSPGHTSFAVEGSGESVMIVGDAIANAHVAFERPGWPSGTDQDAEAGAKTRTALMDRLATDRMAMVGFHLPFPGIGTVERTGTGYRFVPMEV